MEPLELAPFSNKHVWLGRQGSDRVVSMVSVVLVAVSVHLPVSDCMSSIEEHRT